MIERYTRPQMGRIWSEQNKLDKWLQVELAVCEAWAERGVIPRDAIPKLRNARFDLDAIARYLPEMHHDMTVFLRSLADSLGPESRYIHLGLTSQDVMDTALALQLMEATELLEEDLRALAEAVRDRALEHKNTACIGRTHGVHAEPTTFGLKLAAWWDELRRQTHRLTQAKETVSVGKISGTVGTHATVPPDVEADVCGRLGLLAEPVSTQVVHRDRHAHYVSTLAIIAASLEKFATEIRHLQRTEVLEAEEPFAEGQTGSSAMPHKRNPEKCERISGLARLFRGYTSAALENVALWHERDISHSSVERIIIPDACILLDYMLDMFTMVVRGLQVYPENMRRNLELTQGLVFSQRVLLALIDKGLGRQEAYKLVQDNAMRAWRERTPFLDLLGADEEVLRHISRDELASLFDYGFYLQHVDASFRRIGLA
ncbi:MAG: adenylosuccinate lyase [Chloroflexi bacterium RBG_16_64_32]|nr:MAG: adenylosuccinate lyase [Chloroflexi bacterium RBG_16_64_32]